MKYRHSPITTRIFLMLLLLISGVFGAIYWFTVPLIKSNVFALELNANRQVLNIVYDLANRMYSSTESYVDNTLDNHQKRLDSLIDLTENYISLTLKQGRAAGKKDQEIWQAIFSDLRSFEFANKDYLWVANYDSILVSHPSDQYHQQDMSAKTDDDGKLIIPEIVKQVRKQGQGFYKYKWSRLDQTDILDKYSYVRDYPKWGIVIGAGVYIEDVQSDIAAKKQQAIYEINKALKNIKIAKNGYLYVFDSNGNMLFHPNANIHGINFKQQLNPVTNNPIYLDLMAVADTGNELFYKWDKPYDPGNYNYEKLSLVRHLKGFDWYISSSVYIDDLKESSVQLSQRIMTVGFIGLLVAIVIAFLFAEWLTSPIKRLSQTAFRISRGDLDAQTGIERNDELGVLAESFDIMVERLKDNIKSLNSRVASRTKALYESNTQLRAVIDSLKDTQSELQTHESRQRMILDALPAQIAYIDSDLHFVFANKQYRSVFNRTKNEIQGATLKEVVGGEMFEMLGPHIQQALNGEQPIYEYKLKHQGKEIITRRTLLPFVTDSGKIEGFLTLSIDITNEREAEKRLAEASKMKAVGQMSGGLAHDFNNLLTIILGNLLQLQDADSNTIEQQSKLAPAIRATRRGADLTKRLLAFSRKQPLTPKHVDLEKLIIDMVELLKAPLPEKITLETSIEPHLPLVHVDAAQMEDALVNLTLNAVDAMPNGGLIKITASLQKQEITLNKNRSLEEYDDVIVEQEYIKISISDAGHGFSDTALTHAFDPFFTTKSIGAGSGLGLSMVYGFVKQSKGYIRIKNVSSPSKRNIASHYGAQVDILLPVALNVPLEIQESDMAEGTALVDQSSEVNCYGSDLVLLVEDNADLRTLVRKQIVELGYKVIETACADEALEIIQGLQEVAGVISDVVMPGKHDGYDVAKAVNAKFNNAFIFLMTGYAHTSPERDYDVTIINKPFEPDHLKQLLPKINLKGN